MNTLIINGKRREFAEGLPPNLSSLLTMLEIDEATVVAEVDGQIVERKNFGSAVLKDGQKIELIRFVGGG